MNVLLDSNILARMAHTGHPHQPLAVSATPSSTYTVDRSA